uniref:Uncharacterized protein n=1 Tax=Arundo donax TaxID=35708 RepID=A0A0A8YYF2_ARUDO
MIGSSSSRKQGYKARRRYVTLE